MSTGDVLRARVDPDLSRKVHRWAKEHNVNVSEAVRLAVRRLVEQQERKRRVEQALRVIDKADKAGLFQPPKGTTKAGGFK